MRQGTFCFIFLFHPPPSLVYAAWVLFCQPHCLPRTILSVSKASALGHIFFLQIIDYDMKDFSCPAFFSHKAHLLYFTYQ